MPTSFAVIGFGHIGKRHVDLLRSREDAELLAVIDIDAQKGEYLKGLDGIRFFKDLSEMFASGISPQVICIAVPNGLHAQLAIEAMERGCHVVIEKPMALTSSDAKRIIEVSETLGRNAFVVMQNRYSPPSQWLKQIVSDGTLGKIFSVHVNCVWNRDHRYYTPGSWRGTIEQDGGVLFTQFSHFIDLLYWIFGDIRDVRTLMDNFNHEGMTDFADSGISQFRFESGAIGSMVFSTAAWDKNMESSITVIGSKGTVKVGGQYMNEVSYVHIEDYVMPELAPTNPPNSYGAYSGSASNHQYIFDNVINTIAGVEVPTTTAYEGMKVVEIIERMNTSDHG